MILTTGNKPKKDGCVDLERSKTIIVTGGSGFVGSCLCKMLSPVFRVVNWDLHPGDGCADDVICDLSERVPVEESPYYCFHLASATGGILFNQGDYIREYNHRINSNVLKFCRQNDCPLLFVSSLNVLENSLDDISSSSCPTTPYAISKWEAENLFREHEACIVRPSNLFGKRQLDKCGSSVGSSHVIPEMVRKIKETRSPLEVFGDGSQVRNFLHVMDFCGFLITAMNHNSTYNVVSSITLTVENLVRSLMNYCQTQLDIAYDPSWMKYETMYIEKIVDQLLQIGNVSSIEQGLYL